jgi:hypothetical protein
MQYPCARSLYPTLVPLYTYILSLFNPYHRHLRYQYHYTKLGHSLKAARMYMRPPSRSSELLKSIHRCEESLPDRDICGKDRPHLWRVRWRWNDRSVSHLAEYFLEDATAMGSYPGRY